MINLKGAFEGVIESVREFVKDNKKETHCVMNQQGEYQKLKVKIADGHPVPNIGEKVILLGRVVCGEFNGKHYEFVKVG